MSNYIYNLLETIEYWSLKVIFRMSILIFFILNISSILAAENGPQQVKFLDSTKIHWRLEIQYNNNKDIFEGSKINDLEDSKLEIADLGIKCTKPVIEREHIKFSPKKNTGYTRDEERAFFECLVNDVKLKSAPVICSKGYGHKGIGSVYKDQIDYTFSKSSNLFSIKLMCVLK